MTGRRARVRVPTTEYVASTDVVPALVAAGMSATEATATLSRNSARLRRSLRLSEGEGPILVGGETVKVVEIAGVIRLAPGIELDVAPKFLGDKHSEWREDLLAISNYTQRGRISPQHVRARVGQTGDLASVIGRTFVDEFREHYRKPLRVYRQQHWRDFSLDGELDTDEVHERSPDGLPQRAVVLDRRNPYNGLLAKAADVLIGDVRDGAVRNQLHRVRGLLGPQDSPPRVMRPVPARHEPWDGLVALAKHVVSGADLTLQADRYKAPGFVVRTWEAWERLTFLALRRELGFAAVMAQEEHEWGWRGNESITVKPDVTIARGADPPCLVDAKYKTRVERKVQRIAQADLMEASAFMEACGADRIALLYPRTAAAGSQEPCGSASIFDCATILPGRQVVAVAVELRGFSAHNTHRQFAKQLTAAVGEVFMLSDPKPGAALN